MKTGVVVFPVTDTDVLLGKKLRGHGAGKWNGAGGKIEHNETLAAAAIRELAEEFGITAPHSALHEMGTFDFYANGDLGFRVTAYLADAWTGTPTGSDEMTPRWFPRTALPTDIMWAADREWVPHILAGTPCSARIYFSVSGTMGTDQEQFDRIEWA